MELCTHTVPFLFGDKYSQTVPLELFFGTLSVLKVFWRLPERIAVLSFGSLIEI